MIALVEIELIGRVKRNTARVKDRKAAVRYGRSPRNRYRKEPKLRQWVPTLMETWAFSNGCFIGESLRDEEADLQLLPHERPGLVKLGALALNTIPGGVLLESLNALGDHPLAGAVLSRFLQRGAQGQDQTIWYGVRWLAANQVSARPVTTKNVSDWVTQAGPKAVTDELGYFTHAVEQHVLEMISRNDDALAFLLHLGSGPLRDEDLARSEYQRLSVNHSDADIRRYLETYGYINPKGTVGRWYHEHLQSLHDNGSK